MTFETIPGWLDWYAGSSQAKFKLPFGGVDDPMRPYVKANAVQGPIHPALGIAMDMNIGDTGTHIACYDDLFNGKEVKVDVSKVAESMNGIELQGREFVAAIQESREPSASVAQVLPCYQVLHQLERELA
jgi:2-hydroxy-4-carboxymuconate semialdehyde hemiacetal dehydrogenase